MNKFKDNIINYLINHALDTPEKVAFTLVDDFLNERRSIAYGELLSEVNILSRHYELKKRRGKCVILCYNSAIDFIIAFLACQSAGIIPIPVPFYKGTKQFWRVGNVIKDAEATTIFTTEELCDDIKRGLSNDIDLNEIGVVATDNNGHIDNSQSNIPVDYEEISFIQYTSGSTSTPKGVVITSQNLIRNQKQLKIAFDCDKQSKIFTWLPFHHDMGLVGSLLHTIYVGCSCLVMSPLQFMQRPYSWLEAISKYKITHSGGPNFAYDLCVNKIRKESLASLNLSSWKVAYNGSDYIRPETLKSFSDYFKDVGFQIKAFFPCYGLAESTLIVSSKNPVETVFTLCVDKESLSSNQVILSEIADKNSQYIASSGEVVEGSKVKIIESSSENECVQLQPGEICIAGESVTKGYWKKPIDHLFYDIDGDLYLRSGDVGFFYKNELFVCGRYKELIVIRGRNVYPQDIEESAASIHPTIHKNGVAAFGLDEYSDHLIILIEMKREYIGKDILNEVLQLVDSHVTDLLGISPYDIVLTSQYSIPRTTSGKLQRVKCHNDYVANRLNILSRKRNLNDQFKETNRFKENLLHFQDFQSIEKYVVNLIESLSGLRLQNRINKDTELTSLGIDSLKLMEFILTINTDLGIHLDAKRLFEENTIHGVINLIEGLLWIKNTPIAGKEIIL